MLDGFVSPGALIEDLLANAAHETAKAIFSQHYPYHLDEATDAGIRERFPILLSPGSMKPRKAGWPWITKTIISDPAGRSCFLLTS